MSIPRTVPTEFICQSPTHSQECVERKYVMKVPVRFPCEQPIVMHSACIPWKLGADGINKYVCPSCKTAYKAEQLILCFGLQQRIQAFYEREVTISRTPTPPRPAPRSPTSPVPLKQEIKHNICYLTTIIVSVSFTAIALLMQRLGNG